MIIESHTCKVSWIVQVQIYALEEFRKADRHNSRGSLQLKFDVRKKMNHSFIKEKFN